MMEGGDILRGPPFNLIFSPAGIYTSFLFQESFFYDRQKTSISKRQKCKFNAFIIDNKRIICGDSK